MVREMVGQIWMGLFAIAKVRRFSDFDFGYFCPFPTFSQYALTSLHAKIRLNPLLTTDAFIAKWAASGAAERANAQLFVAELCALLGVDAPQPKTPDEAANAYVFEKTIPGAGSSKNFIDCYKRGYFVLEAKQGADRADSPAPLSAAAAQQRAQRKTGHGQRGTAAWDTAMERARNQAEN
jgi:hypothetical protein